MSGRTRSGRRYCTSPRIRDPITGRCRKRTKLDVVNADIRKAAKKTRRDIAAYVKSFANIFNPRSGIKKSARPSSSYRGLTLRQKRSALLRLPSSRGSRRRSAKEIREALRILENE